MFPLQVTMFIICISFFLVHRVLFICLFSFHCSLYFLSSFRQLHSAYPLPLSFPLSSLAHTFFLPLERGLLGGRPGPLLYLSQMLRALASVHQRALRPLGHRVPIPPCAKHIRHPVTEKRKTLNKAAVSFWIVSVKTRVLRAAPAFCSVEALQESFCWETSVVSMLLGLARR